MQKVTYINVYGESLVLGGGPPVLLRSVSGFSRPGGQIVRAQGAYHPGETFSRVQLPSRSVQVQFDILPCADRGALYRQRMQIERVLSSGRCLRGGETGWLVYENDAGAWRMRAVPDGAITYGKRFQNAMAACRVNFLCPDAHMEAMAQETAVIRTSAGGFKLPTALPIRLGARIPGETLVNGGTADAPVTVTVYGTGEIPALINRTTGAQLMLTRAVGAGEQLVVSTDPKALSCVLVRADGSREDAFGYLDPALAVSGFALAPGGNLVEYVSAGAGAGSRVEIAWRARYEGV